MDRSLLDRYEAGGAKLRQAVVNLTADDLRAKPPKEWDSGAWSMQQVIMHIADSEQVFSDRMKWVIAEDNPTLSGFAENQWAQTLGYEDRSAAEAVELVDLTRKQMAVILKKLPESAYQRAGTHSEAGRVTLADLLTKAVNHFDHHLKFIHAKRIKMGKEMW
jgi:uncharacterized damage-inducible protein DinB